MTSLVVLIVLGGGAALLWLWLRASRRAVPAGARAVPEAPGRFPMHQALQLLARPPWDVMGDWLRTTGGPVRFSYLNRHVIVVGSAEMAHAIFALRLSNYRKEQSFYSFMGDLLGTGLVTSEDEAWRRGRTLIAAPFKREMLDAVVSLSVLASRRVALTLRDAMTRGDSVDLAEEFRHMTLQVIGEAVLSMTPEQCDNVFPALYLPIVEEANRRTWYPFRAWLPLPSTFAYNRCVRELNAYVTNLIKSRIADKHVDGDGRPTAKPTQNGDILDRVIEGAIVAGEDVAAAEPVRQLRDEVKTFLLAGHETSSMMLTWALLELIRRPDLMAKVRAEADRVFLDNNGGELSKLPSAEAFKQGLAYTECVLKETLRLHSIVPVVARSVVADDVIEGFHLPAGASVLVHLQAIHHDPKLWPEPMAFKPERFVNVDTTVPQGHRYAFNPFTNGPRSCIGQFFSLLESKIVLALLVRQFNFKTSLPWDQAAMRHPYVLPYAPLHGFPVIASMRDDQ